MSNPTIPPALWLAGLSIGSIGYWYAAKRIAEKDRKAFVSMIREKGITDPFEIWELSLKHHEKLRKELIEAKARIQAGEEICRVGQGLADVRKMLNTGSQWPKEIRSKQLWGQEISEEEKQTALEEMEKQTVPVEVKTAIIAHWWTELWQLFVPWGIVLPEEIEEVKGPFFRLVGPEVREAVLRAEVYKYKEGYKSWKDLYERTSKRGIEENKKHWTSVDVLRKEKKDLQDQMEVLKENASPTAKQALKELEDHFRSRDAWDAEREELLAQIAELKSTKEQTDESV